MSFVLSFDTRVGLGGDAHGCYIERPGVRQNAASVPFRALRRPIPLCVNRLGCPQENDVRVGRSVFVTPDPNVTAPWRIAYIADVITPPTPAMSTLPGGRALARCLFASAQSVVSGLLSAVKAWCGRQHSHWEWQIPNSSMALAFGLPPGNIRGTNR